MIKVFFLILNPEARPYAPSPVLPVTEIYIISMVQKDINKPPVHLLEWTQNTNVTLIQLGL